MMSTSILILIKIRMNLTLDLDVDDPVWSIKDVQDSTVFSSEKEEFFHMCKS